VDKCRRSSNLEFARGSLGSVCSTTELRPLVCFWLYLRIACGSRRKRMLNFILREVNSFVRLVQMSNFLTALSINWHFDWALADGTTESSQRTMYFKYFAGVGSYPNFGKWCAV